MDCFIDRCLLLIERFEMVNGVRPKVIYIGDFEYDLLKASFSYFAKDAGSDADTDKFLGLECMVVNRKHHTAVS